MRREPISSLIRSLFDCFTNTYLNDHWYDSFVDAGAVLYCWLYPASAANKRQIGQ